MAERGARGIPFPRHRGRAFRSLLFFTPPSASTESQRHSTSTKSWNQLVSCRAWASTRTRLPPSTATFHSGAQSWKLFLFPSLSTYRHNLVTKGARSAAEFLLPTQLAGSLPLSRSSRKAQRALPTLFVTYRSISRTLPLCRMTNISGFARASGLCS
jgi:hypothetical protein